MEDLFAQGSLCYLTHRCDEGFELIFSSLNQEVDLYWEAEEVFRLISMNILEKRYKSWLNLHYLLLKTDDHQTRRSIEIYMQIISNELNFYSKKILFLIDRYLFKSAQRKILYLKLQADIHFLCSQISQSTEKFEHIQSSLKFYNQAMEISSHHSFDQVLHNH